MLNPKHVRLYFIADGGRDQDARPEQAPMVKLHESELAMDGQHGA